MLTKSFRILQSPMTCAPAVAFVGRSLIPAQVLTDDEKRKVYDNHGWEAVLDVRPGLLCKDFLTLPFSGWPSIAGRS